MIPLTTRNLIVLFVLFFFGTRIQAQQLHLSDLQALYSADSAAFGNSCRTNGFEKKSFHEYDSSYFISCYSESDKTGFSRSFGKYAEPSGRRSYVLNYSLGANEEEFKRLETEIRNSGFQFIKKRTTDLPGGSSVEDNIYEKNTETISLQTQQKGGTPTRYQLAYFRKS